MKIGIEINAYPCSIEEQLILMKKHGFESTFCFSLSPQIEEIMELCEKYGITVENYHAPFTNIKDLWLDTPEGDAMLRELTDSIDVCNPATAVIPNRRYITMEFTKIDLLVFSCIFF